MQCKTRQYRDTGYKLTGRYGLVPVATRVLSAQQTRPAAVVFISVLWTTHRVALELVLVLTGEWILGRVELTHTLWLRG